MHTYIFILGVVVILKIASLLSQIPVLALVNVHNYACFKLTYIQLAFLLNVVDDKKMYIVTYFFFAGFCFESSKRVIILGLHSNTFPKKKKLSICEGGLEDEAPPRGNAKTLTLISKITSSFLNMEAMPIL